MGKYSKFTDQDYKVKTFRWPYWLLPLLFLSLLLVLGLFIFITIHSADRFGCLFHCEQKIDDGGVYPKEDSAAAAASRRNDQNATESVPKSQSKARKVSEIEMTVSGKLIFPTDKVPEAIPPHSQLKVEFSDSSLQDASSENLGKTIVDLKSYKKGTVLKYEIKCPKPKKYHDSYSVSAVLNMGWTPAKGSSTWLRKGDFLTDTMFNVKITKGNTTFERDITFAYI
jgi:uncharacterized lipoprotein YbaY